MIPNDFGLIRQKDHNLFALLFPNLADISEYDIEVLYVDPASWNLNRAVTGQAQVTIRNGMKYAIVDASKYDYILLPISTIVLTNGIYNGSISSSTLEETHNRIFIRNLSEGGLTVYALLQIDDYKYVVLNQRINDNIPIIGFRRHRSDGVNPKGMSKDAISDILQPIKADEFDGEAGRIRDELPGNTESPDIDSKSGSGADERADS